MIKSLLVVLVVVGLLAAEPAAASFKECYVGCFVLCVITPGNNPVKCGAKCLKDCIFPHSSSLDGRSTTSPPPPPENETTTAKPDPSTDNAPHDSLNGEEINCPPSKIMSVEDDDHHAIAGTVAEEVSDPASNAELAAVLMHGVPQIFHVGESEPTTYVQMEASNLRSPVPNVSIAETVSFFSHTIPSGKSEKEIITYPHSLLNIFFRNPDAAMPVARGKVCCEKKTEICDLPLDTQREILSYLPTEALLACKPLIANYEKFIEEHSWRNNNHSIFFICEDGRLTMGRIPTLRVSGCGTNVEGKITEIVGSSHGLVCALIGDSATRPASFTIFNPYLPSVLKIALPNVHLSQFLFVGYGRMGKDHVLYVSSGAEAHLFQKGSWATIPSLPLDGNCDFLQAYPTLIVRGTFLGGYFYWIAMPNTKAYVVLCFDVAKRNYKDLGSPEPKMQLNFLWVIEQTLHVSGTDSKAKILFVWHLNSADKWVTKYRMDLQKFGDAPILRPLFMTVKGIMLEVYWSMLLLYDTRKMTFTGKKKISHNIRKGVIFRDSLYEAIVDLKCPSLRIDCST
ncbi:hypothetical protein Tsubulata_033222 [Turnera subulata]|uniref:F-box associated domain-containing protein n=1 Tax=Turnera subulata TaxID=218843 RepID=A0A9Q0J4E8_9ROSI|nr:hypothetical protein Tsubulata_033222 [Turnera subulata]